MNSNTNYDLKKKKRKRLSIALTIFVVLIFGVTLVSVLFPDKAAYCYISIVVLCAAMYVFMKWVIAIKKE